MRSRSFFDASLLAAGAALLCAACTSSDNAPASGIPAGDPVRATGNEVAVGGPDAVAPAGDAMVDLAPKAPDTRALKGHPADTRGAAPWRQVPTDPTDWNPPTLPDAPATVAVDDGDLRIRLSQRLGDASDLSTVRTENHGFEFHIAAVRWVQEDGRVLQTLSDFEGVLRRDGVGAESELSFYDAVGPGMGLRFTRRNAELIQELVMDAAPPAPVGADPGQAVYLELLEEIAIDPQLDVFDGPTKRPLPAWFLTEYPITLAGEENGVVAPIMNFSYPDAFDARGRRVSAVAGAHYEVNLDAEGRGVLATRMRADYLLDEATDYPVILDPHTNLGMPPPRIWAANVVPTVPGGMTGAVMMVASNIFNALLNVEIRWGDGNVSRFENGGASFTQHTYGEAGVYDVRVVVCDDVAPPDGPRCDEPVEPTYLFIGRPGTSDVRCDLLDTGCTTSAFDAATGHCEDTNRANGTVCDDGDPATDNTVCLGGVCAGFSCLEDADCVGLNNGCTVFSCGAGGACEPANAAAGTNCDDGDNCTFLDACNALGECVGTPPEVFCDDTNGCTVDSCDPATGQCTNDADVGAACNDIDECTVADSCQADASCAGTDRVCDDSNECTTNACDSGTGCVFTADVGASCDDGEACTENDLCQADESCEGTAIVCSDDNDCTTDACVDGACEFTITPGEACDDENGCTENDVCDAAGECGGVDRVCVDGNLCTDDSCNPANGQCVFTVDVTNACSDGDPCTVADACLADGSCEGSDKDCNDDNACTNDSCNPTTGACVRENNTDACDDNNPLTVNDVCGGGTCSGSPIECNVDGDCDQSNPCFPEICNNNVCVANPLICLDADPSDCMVPQCDPADGACNMEPVAADVPCDDGQALTIGDKCDGAGACIGTPVECAQDADCDQSNLCAPEICNNNACVANPLICLDSDASDCLVPECDPASGLCGDNPKAAGEACDDGDALTENDVCDGSGGCAGTAVECNVDGDCDQSNLCAVETCVAGACVVESPVVCTDPDVNDCFTLQCMPALGMCMPQQVQTGAACDDGDRLTLGDTCDAVGTCSGAAVDCLVNADCDESDLCAPETCMGNSCVQVPVDCDDSVGCTEDECNPADGTCVHVPNPLSCVDSDFCNGIETCDPVNDCQAGSDPCEAGETCNETDDVCEGGGGPECTGNDDCDDGVECTEDVCLVDTCQHVVNPGNCDDGLFCNGVEICDAVLDCQPASDPDPCEADEVCVEASDTCVADSGDILIAASGDSITQAFASQCTDGNLVPALTCAGDYPENSWSTGSSALVDSYAERLAAENPGETISVANAAVTGSEWSDFVGQATGICALPTPPTVVTVLLGQNDVCNSTDVASLPTQPAMIAEVSAGLDVLAACLPPTATVQVYSMLRVDQLRQAGIDKSAFPCAGDVGVSCQAVWSAVSICEIVTAEPDRAVRDNVGDAIDNYNESLAQLLTSYDSNVGGVNPSGVRFVSDWTGRIADGHLNESFGNAIFGACDLNPADCFHPNLVGQDRLACLAWENSPQNPAGDPASCPPSEDPPGFCPEPLGIAGSLSISEVRVGEYIELFNASSDDIDLDDFDYAIMDFPVSELASDFTIANESVVPAGGYLTIDFPGSFESSAASGDMMLGIGLDPTGVGALDYACWGTPKAGNTNTVDAVSGGFWNGVLECAPPLSNGSLQRLPGSDGLSPASYDTVFPGRPYSCTRGGGSGDGLSCSLNFDDLSGNCPGSSSTANVCGGAVTFSEGVDGCVLPPLNFIVGCTSSPLSVYEIPAFGVLTIESAEDFSQVEFDLGMLESSGIASWTAFDATGAEVMTNLLFPDDCTIDGLSTTTLSFGEAVRTLEISNPSPAPIYLDDFSFSP